MCLEKPQLLSELLTLTQASHTALDCAPAAVNLLSRCSRSGARSAALGPGPEVLLLLTRCCCGCCCCCCLCCCCLTPVTCSRLRWPCSLKYSTTILNTHSITSNCQLSFHHTLGLRLWFRRPSMTTLPGGGHGPVHHGPALARHLTQEGGPHLQPITAQY